MTKKLSPLSGSLAVALMAGSGAAYAKISSGELAQYQHSIDVAACNVRLSDGAEILFNGLFANSRNVVAFYEIVTLVIPTEASFGFGTLVPLELNGEQWPGKIVKLESGKVYIATDMGLLGDLWVWGDSTLTIGGVRGRASSISYTLPYPRDKVREQLSVGRDCYEAALNSN